MADSSRARRPAQGGDALGAYLRRVGDHPLLTAADEAALCERISAGVSAQERLVDADCPPSVEEAAALRRAVVDGHAASQQFVLANLRLVVSIARRYQSSPLPLVDLVQEGNLGLLRAVVRFDHRKGFRFSTYATWWIRQAVCRASANQAAIGTLPDTAGGDVASVHRQVPHLHHDLRRTPSDAEIAQAVGITADRLRVLLEYTRVPLSIHSPPSPEGGAPLGDLIADAGLETVEDRAVASTVSASVTENLEVLEQRERQVLTLRFGLDGGEPQSLSDVGTQLGLSAERIRQLEARALCKLRHPAARLNKLLGLLAG